MRFSTFALLALLPAAALGATQTVTVGANGTLAYNPPNITAAAGDTVNFMFMMKNHTVTQSTFAAPCMPAQFNGKPGADSGFLFVPANSSNSSQASPATWSIVVTNASVPLWFHCAQTIPVPHCQKGMVFSINATPQKTFDAFLANAMASNSSAAASNSSTPSSSATSATSASAAAANAAAASASHAANGGTRRAGLTQGAASLLAVVGVGALLL